MEGFYQTIYEMMNTSIIFAVAIPIILAVITILLARAATRLVHKILSRDGVPLNSSSIVETIARIVIYVIGGTVILSSCFGIDVGGLVTALGVSGIALSLGLQDTISNFFGGLQVTVMGIVQPGDHVKIGSTEGIVQDVTWRQTIVKDFENNVHTIPNSQINSGEVEKIEPANLVPTMISFTNDTRDLDGTIAKMEAAAKAAVSEVAELERDPWILLTQIGEYGTWAKMRFVLKEMDHVREARDAALRAIAPYTRMNPEDIAEKIPVEPVTAALLEAHKDAAAHIAEAAIQDETEQGVESSSATEGSDSGTTA